MPDKVQPAGIDTWKVWICLYYLTLHALKRNVIQKNISRGEIHYVSNAGERKQEVSEL